MGIVRSIKNVANGYSSVQILVRNATSNDATGPTTYDMEQISSYTYQSQTDFLEIMDMLDRRLNDKGKNWRHVAKSLTVLDYLVRFGSEKCVMWAKDNAYIVKTLREFVHFDESNNDQGAIIRVKAKELVNLLRDDERLQHERQLAKNTHRRHDDDDDDDFDGGSSRRRNRQSRSQQGDPYDAELEKALELSKLTAQQETANRVDDNDDDDLKAALKLSMEEEEMRKLKLQQNENLLDLDDPQPQYYLATGYYQQQPQQPQFTQYGQVQYDMFGNPIQNPINTGYYQQPQQYQFQQPQPTQQPQFTGFNYQSPQQSQPPQQELTPLKTGSNNPFAMNSQSSQPQPSTQSQTQPSLNDLSSQPQFFTQPESKPTQTTPLAQQNTSSSKYGDHSHPELNNLLASGTGIDTFGNTGDTRVAHHYTKSHSMLTSNYTGIQNTDKHLAAFTTGNNPFITSSNQSQSQPSSQPSHQSQSQPSQPQQQPVYTGYGFGNGNVNNQNQNGYSNSYQKDGPSLIDI